jgi:RHS repeat-associated protein
LGWTQLLNFDTSRTTRGYTGHEGLDPVGLIHMNGRVYDPKLGRFISADPHVQAPGNTQNLNRYSYVLNNPLSYTDPSGYFFKKLFKNDLFRAIVSVAITAFLPGAGLFASELLASVVTGFIAGAVASGSIEGGVIGAFSAGVFFGIGSGFQDKFAGNALGSKYSAHGLALKATAHGLAGGTMSALQGGKFGHGFASAFVTAGMGGAIEYVDKGNQNFSGLRVAAAGVVGGTVSAATGGKFANGAVTGAFSRAFNTERNRIDRSAATWQAGPPDAVELGIGPDKNWLTPDDPLRRGANQLIVDKTEFSVVLHGNEEHVQVRGRVVDAESFVRQVSPFLPPDSRPIRLYSCRTGAGAGSFAQQVADLTGRPVYAPNAYLWVGPRGHHFIAPPAHNAQQPDPSRQGQWIRHCPGGC